MNTLVPLHFYTSTYFHVLLFIVMVTLLRAYVLPMSSEKNIGNIKLIGFILLVFVCFYMGLRPVSGAYFGDMETYNRTFERYQEGYDIIADKDIVFNFFMKSCSYVMTAQTFFLVCALLYVLPLWYLARKWFANYWFYAFLMLVGSFSFWAYGTNGIRNGIATSLFLMALTFPKRKIIMVFFLVLACSTHKTMMLPTLAYGLTLLYNDPRRYLYFWLAAIPLSLLLGSFWEGLFASIGFNDERMSYLKVQLEGSSVHTGFRWDFLLYSATGFFAGWYFVVKRKFKDKIYYHLLNTYLITNAFWILVIRASFSNRFAYLSWFMLGLVIIYPMLKTRFFDKQHQVIGRIIFVYFAFTYFMNIIVS